MKPSVIIHFLIVNPHLLLLSLIVHSLEIRASGCINLSTLFRLGLLIGVVFFFSPFIKYLIKKSPVLFGFLSFAFSLLGSYTSLYLPSAMGISSGISSTSFN